VPFARFWPDHRTGIKLTAIDPHRAAEAAANLPLLKPYVSEVADARSVRVVDQIHNVADAGDERVGHWLKVSGLIWRALAAPSLSP
jgi:hypothetical protein